MIGRLVLALLVSTLGRVVLAIAGLVLAQAAAAPETLATAPRSTEGQQVQDSDRASSVILAGPDEPGERLHLSGRVLDYGGRPLGRAAVVAYHTDRKGLYNPPDSPTRVPRIRGVAVTDEEGRFSFSTIRPAAYPEGSAPAHIHVEVSAPAHRVRHLEYWFDGDPLITREARQQAERGEGVVIVRLRRDSIRTWVFAHDIRLAGN